MKTISFSTVNVYIRPSCFATFHSIYGIGKTKALRLNAFLLNYPAQKYFKRDFISIMYSIQGRSMLTNLFIDKKVRLYVSHNLRDKILIFCYQAYRIFQNLPTKGQRTKANAGTPSHFNPYLSLKINKSFYPKVQITYYRRELYFNGRFEQLKAFNKQQLELAKSKKADRKLKDKVSIQNFIKNQKLGIQR